MATTQNLTELPTIQYTGMDYQSVISQIQEIISSNTNWKENWTQFYNSEAGTMLVQLMAWICDNLAVRQDLIYNEQFLATATSEQSKLRLLNQIGYKQKTTSSSMVEIEIIPKSLSDAELIISNNFETLSDIKDSILRFSANDINGKKVPWEVLDVNPDGTINYLTKIKLSKLQAVYNSFNNGAINKKLFAVQGTTNYIKNISATEDGPVFDLGVPDFDLKTLTVLQENEGSTPITHKKVNSFIDLSEVEDGIPCYIVEKNDNGTWQIRYPWKSIVENNYMLNTHLYPKGKEIHVFFRVSSGVKGNISEGMMSYDGTAINENNKQIGFSIKNTKAGYNGKNGETLNEAVKNAPLSLLTMDRAVTSSDYDKLLKENDLVNNCVTYTPSNMPATFKDWYGRRINPQEAFSFITLNKNYDGIPNNKLNYFPWIDLVKEPVLNECYNMYDGNSNVSLKLEGVYQYLKVEDLEFKNKDHLDFCGTINGTDNKGNKLLKNAYVFKTPYDLKTAIDTQNANNEDKIKIKNHLEESYTPYLKNIYNDFTKGNDFLTIKNNIYTRDTVPNYLSNNISDEYINCINFEPITVVFDDNISITVDLKKDIEKYIGKRTYTNSSGIEEKYEINESDFDEYYLKLSNIGSDEPIDANLIKESFINIYKGRQGAEKRDGIVELFRKAYDELKETNETTNQEFAKKLSRAFTHNEKKYAFMDLGFKFPSNIMSYSYKTLDNKEKAFDIQKNNNPFFKDYSNLPNNGVSEDSNDDEYYAIKINNEIYAFKINPYTISKAIAFYDRFALGGSNKIYYDVYNYIGIGNIYYYGDNKYSCSALNDSTGSFSSNSLNSIVYTDTQKSFVKYITLTPDRFAIFLNYIFSPLKIKESENPDEIDNVLKKVEYVDGKYIFSDYYDDLGIRFSLFEKDHFDVNSENDNSEYTYEDGKEYDIRIDYSGDEIKISSLSNEEINKINEINPVKDFLETEFGIKKILKEKKYKDFSSSEIFNELMMDSINSKFWIRSLKEGKNASIYFKSSEQNMGLISSLGLNSGTFILNSDNSSTTYVTTKAYGLEALELYLGSDNDYVTNGDIIYTSSCLNDDLNNMYISYVLDYTNNRVELSKQENYYGDAPEIIGISGQVVKLIDGEYVIDKTLSDFDVRLTSDEFNGYSFYNINEDNLTNPKLNIIKNKRTSITIPAFNLDDYYSEYKFTVNIDGNKISVDYGSFKNSAELADVLKKEIILNDNLKDYVNIIVNHKISGETIISSVGVNSSIEFIAENSMEVEKFKEIFGTNITNPDFYILYPISAIKKINGENTDVIHYLNEEKTEFYYAPTVSSELKFVYREYISDTESRFGDYYISAEGNNFGNYTFYLNKSDYSENFPDGNFYVHFLNDRTYASNADEIEENILRNYMKKYMIAGTELNFLKPYFRTFDIVLKVLYNPNYDEQELRKKIKSAIENKFKITNLNNISTGNNIYRSDIDRLVLGIEGVISINLKYFGYDKNDTKKYPNQQYALTSSASGTSEDGTDFYIINILGNFEDNDIDLEKNGSISINI